MSAKCSSCRYPLCVSDCVVCRECRSYFHIDCAQLVGFPEFVLSAEPAKNTFTCSTCWLLPLPTDRGDSDNSDDEGMPSRQLDYALEGDIDLGKEMNEMKGGIQDLSDLCKDMLREINDIKSINLTLRCCVENLRHDNEQRDVAISELKHRLDLLEGKLFERKTSEWKSKTCQEEVEQCFETYKTSEEEFIKKEITENTTENIMYDHKRTESLEFENTSKQQILSNSSSNSKVKLAESKLEEESFWEKETEDFVEEKKYTSVVEKSEKEEVKAEIITEQSQNKQDWSWSGNKAIKVDKEEESYEEDEEEGSEVEVENETKNTQSWGKLKEEIQPVAKQGNEKADALSEEEFWDINQDEKSEEKEELGRVRKSVRWDENIADDDTESEADWSQKEAKETTEEEEENKREDQSEVGDGKSVEREDSTSKKVNFHNLEDVCDEGGLPEDTGTQLDREELLVESEESVEVDGLREQRQELYDVESRLEGGEDIEEHQQLECEAEDGGEFRLEDQEFLEEEVLPPASPPIVHTEEDLWMYLKENVSSVHPSTVEEFVQNLIGTLQHVPEEYLKPVIDANIKRVTSPSITDGEHLTTPENGMEVKEECIVNDLGALKNEEIFNPLEAEDPLKVFGEAFTTPKEDMTETSSALQATD